MATRNTVKKKASAPAGKASSKAGEGKGAAGKTAQSRTGVTDVADAAAKKPNKATSAKAPAAKATAKKAPAKGHAENKESAKKAVTTGGVGATATKKVGADKNALAAGATGKPGTGTPAARKALAATKKLLAQKQQKDRQPQPWQQETDGQDQLPDPGFQSGDAKHKALDLHAAEMRQKPIGGSIGTRNRLNQAKRDKR